MKYCSRNTEQITLDFYKPKATFSKGKVKCMSGIHVKVFTIITLNQKISIKLIENIPFKKTLRSLFLLSSCSPVKSFLSQNRIFKSRFLRFSLVTAIKKIWEILWTARHKLHHQYNLWRFLLFWRTSRINIREQQLI